MTTRRQEDPLTTYDARLDTLVQARHQAGRWRRWGLWLLGACLSVPVMVGLLTLFPAPPPSPPAPPTPSAPVAMPVQRQAAASPPAAAVPQARGGYKGFVWGESVQAVKRQAPDMTRNADAFGSFPFVAAYAYQHGRLYTDRIANPLALLRGTWETYTSEASETDFVFYDGRLCAVTDSV
jgi:hypothetical protein